MNTYKDKVHANEIYKTVNIHDKTVTFIYVHNFIAPILNETCSLCFKHDINIFEKSLNTVFDNQDNIHLITRCVFFPMNDTKYVFEDILAEFDIDHDFNELYDSFIEMRGDVTSETHIEYYARIINTLIENLSDENKQSMGIISNDRVNPHPVKYPILRTENIKNKLNVKIIFNYMNITSNESALNDDIYQLAIEIYDYIAKHASIEFLMKSFTLKTLESDDYTELCKSLPSNIKSYVRKINNVLSLKDNKVVRMDCLIHLIIDFINTKHKDQKEDMMNMLRIYLKECDQLCAVGIFNRLMVSMHPFIEDEDIRMNVITEIRYSLSNKILKLSNKDIYIEKFIVYNNMEKLKQLIFMDYFKDIVKEFIEEYKDISDENTITNIIKDIINKL